MGIQIQVVKDNKEKQITYAAQMGRYKLAMKHKFYLEAISIVYAMCEDRLKSFLYHSGCMDREMHITENYKKEILVIWKQKDESRLKLDNIKSKYTYIGNMLKWAEKVEKTDNEFEKLLKDKIIGAIDIGAFRKYIKELEKWCNLRNEIVHGLLNKSMEVATEKLKECAENGILIARCLDEETKKYRLGNDIRRRLKI